MIWNDGLKGILDRVIVEASERIVGLWGVQMSIRRAFPRILPGDSRKATLAIVERAICEHDIVVGSFTQKGFVMWPLQFEAVPHIEARWQPHERDVRATDNVWLCAKSLKLRPW
jgi:hypothetical protein